MINILTTRTFIDRLNKISFKQFTVLSKYTGINDPISIKHNVCGMTFVSTPYKMLHNKNKCPFCSKNRKALKNQLYVTNDIKGMVRDLAGNKYTILNTCFTYDSIIHVRYNCTNTIFKTLAGYFLKVLKKKRDKQFHAKERMPFSEARQRLLAVAGKEFTLITYHNSKHAVIKHNVCNRSFSVNFLTFLITLSCPYCKMSRGEAYVKQFLVSHNIKYIYGFRLHNSLNQSKRLHLDFYLPKYDIGIEYDGIQHFSPVKNFGGKQALKCLQHNDHRKNRYCKNSGIKLIRIEQRKFIPAIGIKNLVYNTLLQKMHL